MVSRKAKIDRHGFTVTEVALTSAMMAWLAIIVSTVWSGLGWPLIDGMVGTRVAQEANIAAHSLALDFSGYYPRTVGGPDDGKLVGRLLVGGNELWLCYDGGAPANGTADWAAPDTVIIYRVDVDQLVRANELDSTVVPVATGVDQLAVTEQGDGVLIELTLTYRDLTRTYEIVAKDP